MTSTIGITLRSFDKPTVRPCDGALDVIARASRDRPFVVAQLGQSLDGRIATLSGESRWINNGAALDHVHRLRAAVDAVVIGVGTALADDPVLTVRRVGGRNPARVIIDPNGRLSDKPRCLMAGDGADRLVINACGARRTDGVGVIGLERVDGIIPPGQIVAALFERGYRRLLIEGGATTVSGFIDAGVVDRLHVLVAPVILGSGKAGLSLAPIERLAEAQRPKTTVYLLGDGDVLFDCALKDEFND